MGIKFTIKATIDGYTGDLTIESEKLDTIRAVLGKLPQHGVTSAASFEFPRTPDGTPICPKHGVEMRKREKQGDEWWSHRVINRESGEEMYCRGYASVNSPGYDVPADQASGLDDDAGDEAPPRRTPPANGQRPPQRSTYGRH